MKRIFVYIIIGLILSGIVLVVALPFISDRYAITGYDGPVATFKDVDWADIKPEDIGNDVTKNVASTHVEIYPTTPDLFDLIICTGLKAEIQAVPNIMSQTLEDRVSKSVIDESAETNTTTTVEIYRAKCQMQVKIGTYEGGLATIKHVTFWVELKDNAYSIFSSAEDRYAYFVEVYTYELPKQEGSMTVTPSGTGLTIESTPIEEEPVPQWLIDAGYTTAGSKLTDIKFPLVVDTAVPVTTVDLGGMHRLESYTIFYIQFDVILTGKWTHISDYKEAGWPEWPDFWGTLLDMLMQFLWYVVGFIGSAVIVWRIKDVKYALVLLAVLWLLVGWQLGWLGGLGI